MSEEKLRWCLKQNRGIELIEPNNNLVKAYLIKVDNSINVMRNLSGNVEWEISSAYYSVYYSIYAILMKIGIKGEIHSCSVELLEFFFKNDLDKDDFNLIKKLKELRERVQYYIFTEEEIKGYEKIIIKVVYFNLKSRKIINNLSELKINKIRCNFKELVDK